MLENERHLEHLQIKLALKEKVYKQEKLRIHQLRNVLEEFDKLRKVQRNCIVQMKGGLEYAEEAALLVVVNENKSQACFSLLREYAEANLLENLLP